MKTSLSDFIARYNLTSSSPADLRQIAADDAREAGLENLAFSLEIGLGLLDNPSQAKGLQPRYGDGRDSKNGGGVGSGRGYGRGVGWGGGLYNGSRRVGSGVGSGQGRGDGTGQGDGDGKGRGLGLGDGRGWGEHIDWNSYQQYVADNRGNEPG